ncbi:hypothetical protein [Micromonospora costi]|uniref:hypothetical protein n=1 Tax=Micromonospora costi TaxID=1530042 RepID=UPI001F4D62CC|nr:hypothetical protein [Micromonospora costi]
MPKLPRSVLVLLPVLALTACGGAGGVTRDGPATPSATGAAPVSSAPPDTVVTPTPTASTPPPAATRSPARPPLSSTTLPTPRPPVVKPSPPTDLVTRHVSGFVTRGGDGPCYGMVAEDGTEYALHGPDVGELRTGSFVTLRLTTLQARIDCGPGVPMSIVTD